MVVDERDHQYEPPQKWRVTKEISYGHMLTIASVAIAALVFTIRLEGRINVNSVAIGNNSKSVDQINARMNTQYSEIIRRLDRVSDKIDDKADK